MVRTEIELAHQPDLMCKLPIPSLAHIKERILIYKIRGELQVDSERGVIYFHSGVKSHIPTSLRICGLPTPIPDPRKELLDVTLKLGVKLFSWIGLVSK